MEIMELLKSNLLSIILLLVSGGILIYSSNTLINKPEYINPNTNVLNIDSIKSVFEFNYRIKLDSINQIHQYKINVLESKNKELEHKIKSLNSDIGELPDFE